jgi:SNF2 family DNA or RNA helicase
VETERRCERQCNDLFGMAPGRVRVLEAGEAIAFVRNGLGGFRGIVEGRELADAFKLRERPLRPRLRVAEGRGGLYRVEVDTDGASPEALLGAWERGESLVPLLDGGFAPLPRAWLEANGWRLAELLASRNEAGEVAAHTAPSLAAFAEDSGEPLPPSLDALRRMLEGLDTLPTRELPAGLRAELRPYQRRGLDWLLFLRDAGLGGVLADDMGLGKTLQALCAIASGPGPSLVVAPTSVIRNWMHEAARFLPHLRCCLYHGPERRIDEGADLVITSYALLRRDAERLASKAWAWAVLDEAQNIKNPDSQVARAARGLAARHRLALSGTPIENRLEELWSILGFVLPGFLGERRSFSERVSASLASADRASALAWLRQRVRPFILRRLKRDVEPDLPPRTDIVWRCEMAEAQRALYDSVRHTTLGELRRALGQGRILGALEALLRLRQAACHPALLPGVEMKDSVKVEVLMDALPQLVAEGHRALVFSQWTGFLDLLEPELQASALEYCRLDGSTRDRASVVERFQSEAGPPIFLISLKAGGMGLNLTAADYVFHLDPWWNPAVEDQAVDRAHRIGQRRPVLSVRLVAADTVEERILALQESKRGLADAMLSGEESLLRGLSREELLALFEA